MVIARDILSLHRLEVHVKVQLLGDFLLVLARVRQHPPAISEHVEK
jgi:hypothetical protein